MSKKLLNEAAVRRFMGLAGMEANVVSNTVNEMYKDEGKHEKAEEETHAEGKHADKEEKMHAEGMDAMEGEHKPAEEGEYMEEEMDAMEGEHEDAADELPPEPEEASLGSELNLDPDTARAIIQFAAQLEAALDAEAEMDAEEEELADDLDIEDAELDVDEMDHPMEEGEDHEDKEEMMMKEDEIVQEVARRVAARILKAKKAQKEMNEALGK